MNRDSLAQRFNYVNQCGVCMDGYDKKDRKPWIICKMHHSVCSLCLQNLGWLKKCPFCRQMIVIKNVIINKYIFDLLPNRGHAQDDVSQDDPPQHDDQIAIQQQLANQNTTYKCIAWKYLQQKLEMQDSFKRKLIYYIVLVSQIPYVFFDLYFAASAPDQMCMDRDPYQNFFALRLWFLVAGIMQLTLMISLLLGAASYIMRIIEYSNLNQIEAIIVIIWAVKNGIQIFVDIVFCAAVVASFCSGGVYFYMIGQLIVYGIAICALKYCSSSERN